ncbi:MAG TPA: hypothetical protein VFY12_00725, partial [Arenimonas sp.]|nr:hypothetical protein [Arenimonas sp.]
MSRIAENLSKLRTRLAPAMQRLGPLAATALRLSQQGLKQAQKLLEGGLSGLKIAPKLMLSFTAVLVLVLVLGWGSYRGLASLNEATDRINVAGDQIG